MDKDQKVLMHILMRMGDANVRLIVYWSDEDSCFVAEVPELSGCMADGATYEDAVKNAQVIIDEWIETARKLGREIPVPKGRLVYA